MVDTLYTNGVIAVKEKSLLGDKLLRFAELSAGEALRALTESGFGGGEHEDGEAMCGAEERLLDAFVREYAPTAAERAYLLLPRDFHNAKAVCKALRTGADPHPLFAPDGLVPAEEVLSAVRDGEPQRLGKPLEEAVRTCMERENATGAEIGAIFDRALYRALLSVCGRERVLKKLIVGRADRTDILTAMRAKTAEYAETLFIGAGKLTKEGLLALAAGGEPPRAMEEYADFIRLCRDARERGIPYTEAERALESFEWEYFDGRKYDLEGRAPFLYYVFRRRAEIANVRILLVCLNANLPPQEIKKRLRAI